MAKNSLDIDSYWTSKEVVVTELNCNWVDVDALSYALFVELDPGLYVLEDDCTRKCLEIRYASGAYISNDNPPKCICLFDPIPGEPDMSLGFEIKSGSPGRITNLATCSKGTDKRIKY